MKDIMCTSINMEMGCRHNRVIPSAVCINIEYVEIKVEIVVFR